MMTWSVSKGFVACLGNLQQTNLLPSTRWEINWWNGHQFAQGLDTTLSKCHGGRTPFPSRFPLLCTFPQGYFLKHILFKLSLNWSHLTTKSTDKCCPTHQHLRRAQESSLHRRGATVTLKVVYYETQPPNFSCDTAQGFWGLACFQSDSRRESVKKKKQLIMVQKAYAAFLPARTSKVFCLKWLVPTRRTQKVHYLTCQTEMRQKPMEFLSLSHLGVENMGWRASP